MRTCPSALPVCASVLLAQFCILNRINNNPAMNRWAIISQSLRDIFYRTVQIDFYRSVMNVEQAGSLLYIDSPSTLEVELNRQLKFSWREETTRQAIG